jgi:hypothetical protein
MCSLLSTGQFTPPLVLTVYTSRLSAVCFWCVFLLQDLDSTLETLGIDLSSRGASPHLLLTSSSLPSLLSDRLASLTASSPGWATPTATQVKMGCVGTHDKSKHSNDHTYTHVCVCGG